LEGVLMVILLLSWTSSCHGMFWQT